MSDKKAAGLSPLERILALAAALITIGSFVASVVVRVDPSIEAAAPFLPNTSLALRFTLFLLCVGFFGLMLGASLALSAKTPIAWVVAPVMSLLTIWLNLFAIRYVLLAAPITGFLSTVGAFLALLITIAITGIIQAAMSYAAEGGNESSLALWIIAIGSLLMFFLGAV